MLKLKYYEAKYEHRVLNFKLRGVQSNYAKRNFLKELVCLFVCANTRICQRPASLPFSSFLILKFFILYLVRGRSGLFLKFLFKPIDHLHAEDQMYLPVVDVPDVGLGLSGHIRPHLRGQVVTSVHLRPLAGVLEARAILQEKSARYSLHDPEIFLT